MEITFVRGPVDAFLVPFLGSWPFLQRQSRQEHEQRSQKEWSDNRSVERSFGSSRDVVVGGRCHCDREDAYFGQLDSYVIADLVPTKLDDDLAEIVWMPRPIEEAYITYCTVATMCATEAILLNIRHTLHNKANREEDDARNVTTCSKSGLLELRDVGRVQKCHGQGYRPHPKHLEYPKTQERPEFVAFVVETIILSSLEDSKQKKSTQPCGPSHDENRNDNIARLIPVVTEAEGQRCQENEVGTTRKICKFVEFEAEGDGKEEELIGNCDDESDQKVVFVEDVDGAHDDDDGLGGVCRGRECVTK